MISAARGGTPPTAWPMHSDLTGAEIERALLAAIRAKSESIHIYRDHIALDLIKYQAGGKEHCAGAIVFCEEGRTFDTFYAPVTMLASAD